MKYVLALALLTTTLTIATAGCSFFERTDDLIVMPVDSVQVPPSAQVGAPFDVRLVGVLLNGCQHFERLDAEETDGGVELTMLARERITPVSACTDATRLVVQTYQPVTQRAGTFVVAVRQRDGSVIEHAVRVE